MLKSSCWIIKAKSPIKSDIKNPLNGSITFAVVLSKTSKNVGEMEASTPNMAMPIAMNVTALRRSISNSSCR